VSKIQVQGLGMYDDKTLKKKIIQLASDLQKNAKKGDWSKASENGIRALGRMWGAYQDWSRNNESVNEAGTKSIDGEELMNFLMKRFKYSKKKAIDVMKKHKMDTSFLKNESVNEAAMELNKIKDAILMFQKKIKKQGRVTNARDEDHLKNLIKLYKKMGGKGVKESVNEGQKKRASDILRKFDMAYIKFSQEVRDVMKLMDKSTGSKVDGKIINKAYGKHLIPFDDLMQSWAKGQQENPGLSEDD